MQKISTEAYLKKKRKQEELTKGIDTVARRKIKRAG